MTFFGHISQPCLERDLFSANMERSSLVCQTWVSIIVFPPKDTCHEPNVLHCVLFFFITSLHDIERRAAFLILIASDLLRAQLLDIITLPQHRDTEPISHKWNIGSCKCHAIWIMYESKNCKNQFSLCPEVNCIRCLIQSEIPHCAPLHWLIRLNPWDTFSTFSVCIMPHDVTVRSPEPLEEIETYHCSTCSQEDTYYIYYKIYLVLLFYRTLSFPGMLAVWSYLYAFLPVPSVSVETCFCVQQLHIYKEMRQKHHTQVTFCLFILHTQRVT